MTAMCSTCDAILTCFLNFHLLNADCSSLNKRKYHYSLIIFYQNALQLSYSENEMLKEVIVLGTKLTRNESSIVHWEQNSPSAVGFVCIAVGWTNHRH